MLCQSCGQHTANTHIKSIVNGELTERHLCSQCATKMGYSSLFDGMNMSSLIGSFLTGKTMPGLLPDADTERCEKCGSTFRDIAQNGKVGCAQCYTHFQSRLLPTVQRVHGNTNHAGKMPASIGGRVALLSEIDELKRKLQEVVAVQDFEQAAKLRDEIKEKEKEADAK